MNRRELVSRAAEYLRENDCRKELQPDRHTLHISDNDGNHTSFVVKKSGRSVPYNNKDVEQVLESIIKVIEDATRKGERTHIHGFLTIELRYMQPKKTKHPDTREYVEIPGHFIPRFKFGNDLRLAAKIYEMSLNDGEVYDELYNYSGDDDDDDTDDISLDEFDYDEDDSE